MAQTFPKITRLDKPALPDCYGIANSALGFIFAAWQGDTLVRISILPAGAEKDLGDFLADWKMTLKTKRDDKRAEKLVQNDLFTNGQWTGIFPDTLALGFYGSDFQFKAMQKMLKIPSGRTTSYLGLADAANSPGAARAAGSVCAKNPLPLVVPCHRIIATNGGMGNYGYGVAMKRQLLEWEAQ